MGGSLVGHQNCVCTFDDWLEDLLFIDCVRSGQPSYAVSPEIPSKDDFCLFSGFAGQSVTGGVWDTEEMDVVPLNDECTALSVLLIGWISPT